MTAEAALVLRVDVERVEDAAILRGDAAIGVVVVRLDGGFGASASPPNPAGEQVAAAKRRVPVEIDAGLAGVDVALQDQEGRRGVL